MSFYTRVGESASTGAPLGVSVDVARTTDSDEQARETSSLFTFTDRPTPPPQRRGSAFLRPGYHFNSEGEVVRDEVSTFRDLAEDQNWNPVRWVVRALEWGTETTGNLFEASMRTMDARQRDGFDWTDIFSGFTANPILGWTQSDWRENWNKSVEAEASVFQTGWLLSAQYLGGERHGIEGTLDLLDDPNRRADRDLYFSDGAAHWVTGVGDALWQIVMDPLIVGSKVGAGIKATRAALTADDVAQLGARALSEGAELSAKQTRAWNLMERLARLPDQVENTDGLVRALSRSRWLRGSVDGGAIAYALARAGEDLVDPAAKVAARVDVLLAGMGDAGALARVGERSAQLAVELQKMSGHVTTMVADDILRSAALQADEAIELAFKELNDGEMIIKEIGSQAADIRREIDALRRVTEDVGAPVPGALRQVGDLASVPGARDVMRVAKTVRNGRFLEPLHFLTGRHIPGVFRLSGDGAAGVMHAAVRRASWVARATDRKDEFLQRLLGIEDRFVATPMGAVGKADRGRLVDEFNNLVDEIIAHRYNLKPSELQSVHGAIRARRGAQVTRVLDRFYKAKQAGEVPWVCDADGSVFVLAGDLPDDAVRPVLQSQVSDYVSIVDPRVLDRFASTHFKEGLGGWLMTDGVRLTESALSAVNRLWKFGALFRPGAYFVRAQLDEQLRLLMMLGPMKYMGMAARGVRNFGFNLARMDKGLADELARRYIAGQRVDNIELMLRTADDPAPISGEVTSQAAHFESRLRELGAERAKLRFARNADGASAKISEIDAKVARLGPRAVKTRERLLAQRERLVESERNWKRAVELDDELRELNAQIAHLRGLQPDRMTALRKELAELQDLLAKPLDPKLTGTRVRVRSTVAARRIGQTSRMTKRGTYRGGKVDDAYLSHEEFLQVRKTVNAEDAFYPLMAGLTRGQVDSLRRMGGFSPILGTDPDWARSAHRAINGQIRGDELGRRILEGQTDEELVAWLRGAQGRDGPEYLHTMYATGKESAEAVVLNAREHVDTILPPGHELRNIAVQRDVTLKDLEGAWATSTARPIVPGELLASGRRGDLIRAVQHFERSYFKYVAELPEETMARHPFYAARFKQHADNLVRDSGLAEDGLTLEQVNAIRRQAARKARRDVETYLFDTSKTTNAGHMFRFISPFYGAWEDTMVKWARILGAHPEAIPGGWKLLRSPNAAGMVVDRDGNLIDVYGNIRNEDGEVVGQAGVWDGYVIVPLPSWAQEATGAKDIRFNKNGINVVFQGDPWWLPGPGPLLAIPTNELIVEMFPEAFPDEGGPENPSELLLKWILPFGPTSDSALEQFAPSWARAARDAITQDGRRVDAVFAQLYMEQVNMERRGEADPLTHAERVELVSNRTRNWTLLRLLGTQSPATFTPQSRLHFYRDEFNRMQRQYGSEAEERFLAEYPDYFEMMISLSVNETGLTATDESWGAVSAYRADMARDPEYGWFWAGAANVVGGEFDQGVYHAQLRQEVGPGSSTRFRSRRDPLEAAREANVSQGWREFQQVNQALRLKLEERGLRSFSAKGADDLSRVRDAFLADLSQRNPDWAAAYQEGGNPGKVTEFLSLVVDQFYAHPELTQRGDGIALISYINVREAIRAKMAERGLSSINAEANADLLALWEAFTAQLIASDIGFEQAWVRVLSRDDLSGDIYSLAVAT